MGEYMEVAIFKEVKEPSFLSGNVDKFFYELSKAKTEEEKDNIFKKYSLYDEELKTSLEGMLKPRFWDFKDKKYVTTDGIYGLYSIFPPHHLYYKWTLPDFWLLMTKPNEFEYGKNFGRTILTAESLKERIRLLEGVLSEDSLLKNFLYKEILTNVGDTVLNLRNVIFELEPTDLIYLNLGNILTNFDNPNQEEEILLIQNMRAKIVENEPNIKIYLQQLNK